MVLTQTTIDQYLAAKTNSWAPTTLRSEGFRLKALLPLGDMITRPVDVYTTLQSKYKPYALQTLFVRLKDYMTWALKSQIITENPYMGFMEENRNLFKNAYKTEKVNVTYDQALAKIKKITDEVAQRSALVLLKGGLRSHELHQINGTEVTGKGGKVRPLMVKAPKEELAEYSKLYGELKKVGLKPHTLRKLFATKLVESGMSPQDLCMVMGWSSFATAQRYLQPKADDKLRSLVNSIVNS